jgi:adenosylmethionine-8-amino-7-oxononanoate aminotransferase
MALPPGKDRYAFVPRPGAVPLEIERAEGAYLYTADGRAILDAAGGAVVANIGHGRPEVALAMAQAVEREGYVVPVFATESRLRLLDRLREHWLPEGLPYVYLASGGSESVDAAIRLALQHFAAKGETSRWKVIGRDLSYHGATLAALAAGGSLKRRAGLAPLLYDWPKAPAQYCLRCPLGKQRPTCETDCVAAIERVIEQAGPKTIAAVIAEPVVGSTAGALVPPPDYWPRLRETCTRHGVLLIADEVMAGFGRTGERFAVDHWQTTPDILVGGKGLGGGYAPIGGVYASEAVVAPIAEQGGDLMFYTFGAHPSACAAADKVLEILQREDLVARAARVGLQLHKRLAVLENHPNVAEVRGLGLLLAVELVADRDTNEPFPAEANLTNRVLGAALGEGVFFYPGGCPPTGDVLVLGPPFVIDDAEVEKIGSVLEYAIDSAVQRSSFEG